MLPVRSHDHRAAVWAHHAEYERRLHSLLDALPKDVAKHFIHFLVLLGKVPGFGLRRRPAHIRRVARWGPRRHDAALIDAFKGGGVDMPDRGGYSGLARTVHSVQRGRAEGARPARWSRRAMIPSPLLRRAVVAALAALAISWPGLLSARAQSQ